MDCFVHIYKYWCSCLHKAYHYQTEMSTFRSPRNSPSEPTNLVVRALPPSYSAVLITCESPGEHTSYEVSREFCKALNSRNNTATGLSSPPQGMPPSYSSIFLRGFMGDARASRMEYEEGQALLGEFSNVEVTHCSGDIASASRHCQRLEYPHT